MPFKVTRPKSSEPRTFSAAAPPTQSKIKPKKTQQSTLKKYIEKEKKQLSQLNKSQCSGGLDEKVSKCESNNESPQEINEITSQLSSVSLSKNVDWLTQKIIHNEHFREYCTQKISFEINQLSHQLLQSLIKFQDRQHKRDANKGRVKKRYVSGFREILKLIEINKIKCVIIAPDVQQIMENGILDQIVTKLITACKDTSIPIIFAHSKYYLAKILLRKSKISCVGIISYDGRQVTYKFTILCSVCYKFFKIFFQTEFNHLMELVKQARQEYDDTLRALKLHLTTLDNESFQSILFKVENHQMLDASLLQYRQKLVDKKYQNTAFKTKSALCVEE